ncbi:MAG: TM0106 family RecB-like putative nuclease [Candidatus Kerfeldbacteria bacterium]|nr:TM0106 family RecB-like putative nuclease [Candidatus Kerfeldbacteria bacterium]
MITFTPSLFFEYTTCPHWIWYDRFGDQRRKGELPELARRLMEQGVMHEEDYIKDLAIVTVPVHSGEAAYRTTEQFMRQGVPYIYQGAIRWRAGDYCYQGRPDLLQRVSGQSSLGSYYYRPIDIKSAKDIKREHWLQLCLYAEILEHIQALFPSEVAIINADHEHIDYQLTNRHRQELHQVITAISQVMQGQKPPLKLVGRCKQSPWFNECVRAAEQAKDIALIYKLNERSIAGLRRNEINTINQLAATDLTTVPAIPYLSESTLQRAQLQAQALLDQQVHWLAQPDIPETPLKIYFDIEGDPLLQIEYLFGFWIEGDVTGSLAQIGQVRSQPNRSAYYLYFLAEQPNQTEQLWQQFLQWLELLPPAAYTIYHFADYERSRTRGLADRYGGSTAFTSFQQQLIDLAQVVQRSVIFPLYFYSIKDIAKSRFLNYRWRHKKAGGAQSIFWYEQWLESGDRQILDDIINYNEDDVIATAHLHQWLKHAVTYYGL